ncbi:hypothetical protein LZ480_04390 [Solibacillus sp. MA9]|uniref:Lipoprotein n=1 Tax=Solibacillus palustris TaxID=2908203 RepID=A0ABS9U9X0_9BACL|nr:hypothetical protein [Solibacillus sp. MA9]MCH7321123.1 hypothetical protein [Solibacillus sp. MA9]
MKKLLFFILCLLIVSGCTNGSTTSISIEKKVPNKIEKILKDNPIEKDTGLQLFSNGNDTYYIIYETTKQMDFIPGMREGGGSEMTFLFREGEEQNKLTRYVYKFKSDNTIKTINISLNGVPTSFDRVSQY